MNKNNNEKMAKPKTLIQKIRIRVKFFLFLFSFLGRRKSNKWARDKSSKKLIKSSSTVPNSTF